ncbi:MAG: putative RNA-binding protein [Bacteroidetes bacterium]|nr:putative RNA-binding protein [Bacteroidota bacterium]
MTTTFELRKKDEFIQLIQLLKVVGIAETGGAAQDMVLAGEVKVNGEVDLRKRAKIKPGDVVEVWEERIEVI